MEPMKGTPIAETFEAKIEAKIEEAHGVPGQEMQNGGAGAFSRRDFLARLSVAGLGAVAVPLLAGCGSGQTSSNGFSNAAFPGVVGRNNTEVVLNYALTVKIAEADLYRQALNRASGRALTQALDPKLPLPGQIANYTRTLAIGAFDTNTATEAFLYLLQFAYIEATHRDYLTAVLTGLGAPQAQANVKGYQFANNEPGADLKTIITNVYPIEETGVRAFLGAITSLSDNNTAQIINAIQSTEARHATTFAHLLGKDPGPSQGVTSTIDLSIANATGILVPATDVFEYYSQPSDVLSKLTAAYYVK